MVSGREATISEFSPEILEKLQCYQGLLKKWQGQINLVSPASIEDSWVRHFIDSAQLADFIPQDGTKRVLVDLGSGAGFPGLVLAMIRPDLEVHLVESNHKKSTFLRTVSRETHTAVTIHTLRIEEMTQNLGDVLGGQKADILTARALASLEALLGYSLSFTESNADLLSLFPKGQNHLEEIKQAQSSYSFELENHASKTDSHSQILAIRALQVLK